LYYPKILARREQFRGAGAPACRVETRLDAWARQTEASTQSCATVRPQLRCVSERAILAAAGFPAGLFR